MSQGWIVIDKSGGAPVVRRKVPSIDDVVQQHLIELTSGKGDSIPDSVKNDYKKRKLMVEQVTKSFIITKGPEFTTVLKKLETDLTSDMLASGAWKDLKFKDYNFEALGAPPAAGHLHPLLKVRTEVVANFVQMGFQEMPTNNYVESSFWNFDALFQPQQHPARDAQDTFFITNPAVSTKFPADYLQRVKDAHEKGGNGSIGYRYDWKLDDAQKNVLRTHTTAVSARMLYKLANQEGGFKPVKYFSIDKVFRNETLDATHLAEFHQVEGVIAGVDVTLGDLMGVIGGFFEKMGLTELEFKPAYNPYTEPSMEIFCYHKGLGKWIEIGNSGMFRREMLDPMNIPANVNVHGFGLSLERPTMIKYGFKNIRDLVGPKVDIKMVQESPMCRLDK
jgi:phenylalanyl-tRNA synthetase alpha chain